jgi:hypothetical protein
MPSRHAACLFALVLAAAPLAASGLEVRDREANQQGRIGQGVENGQLTAHETGNLEHREVSINATRKADLAAHGGHLTVAEKHHLNHRENDVSHQIHRDKHNDATQPGVAPH